MDKKDKNSLLTVDDKIKIMKIAGITWILLLFFTLTLFSSCKDSTENQSAGQPFFSSYLEIPGITLEEISAIESLQERVDSFVFGMMPNTEAFLDSNGEIKGFTALFCQWLTELLGIPFIPKHFAWNELLEGLESGGIDFAGNLTATDERRMTYFMTNAIAQRTVKYLRLAESQPLSEITRTRLPRYAMLSGTTTIEKVFQHAVEEFEVVYIHEYTNAYEMLYTGEIDALIAESTAEAMFSSYGNVVTSEFLPLIYTPVSLAAQNPGLEPVISVIQKALDNGITGYLNELYNKGYQEYTKHKLYMTLSREEIEYIRSNPVIPFAAEYDNYPVSFFSARDRDWQGISIDVLKKVELLTGLNFTVVNDPHTEWTQLLRMLEDGDALVLSELVRIREREGRFLWPGSSFFSDQSALISKIEYRDIDINDIYSIRVGLIKDTAHSALFQNWFPDHNNTIVYDTKEETFEALRLDKIDMVMNTNSNLLYLTNYQEITGYKANFVFNNSFESTFGFNKDAVILCSIIDKALDLIDTGVISQQWLRRSYDYRLKLAQAQFPWIIGAALLFLIVLILAFIYLQRSKREGKRLEDLVQKRAAAMSSLFEANPHMNVLFDSNFKLVDCNPAAYKLMGFETKDDMLKNFVKRLSESIPAFQPGGKPSIPLSERLTSTVKNGSEKFETELVVKGETRTWNVTFIKIPYENNFAIVGYVFDMTDIHNREIELIRAQELNELQIVKMNLMVKATKIGLWDMEVVKDDPINPANTFIWSDEFKHMLGFTEEMDFPNVLSSWSDRLHPDDKERTLAAFKNHMLDKTGKTPYDVEYKLLKKNGEYAYYRASGESIRDENGAPIRVAGALMDITETKDILLETERQKIEAEAASRAKSDFLSTMSHEMRTPMNAIIGMTAVGKKAENIEQKNHALTKIGDASNHLLGVINDVLDMAKIEANKLELIPIEYDLEKMLQKVITIIHFRVDEKQQELTINIDSNIPRFIIGDDQRLAQVITNLLSNANKFTPEGGKIHLDVSLVQETSSFCELKIEVSDNGIGIAHEQQKRLFMAFEQAESGTSRTYGGTGLGLVISKRIVELMDGSIWIDSDIGKGAKFLLTVKAKRGRKNHDNESFTTIIKQDENIENNTGRFTGKRLLLAEDIEINRAILVALLEDTKLIIDCAENGKEAVEMIEASPYRYDIVFMDIQMPIMDGLEATRQIRIMEDRWQSASPMETYKRLPIVAMTANVFKDDIEACLAAGMNGHLGKPLDIDRVYEKLRNYL